MQIHLLLKALAIGIISSSLIIPFTFTGLYRALELRFYDLRLKLRPQRPVTDKVILIAIDDQSIKTLGRWPWTRDKHSALIDTLSSLGARSIALDIEFLEESPPTVEKALVEDKLREVKERLMGLSQDIHSLPQGATHKEGEPLLSQQLVDYYSTMLLEEGMALEADIEEIIVDHDKKLVKSVALSNRTILAFHPVEFLPGNSSLSPLYPTIKKLIAQGQAQRAENLAQSLSLNKRQHRELTDTLPFIKERVALELFYEGLKKDPQTTKKSLLQDFSLNTLEEGILDKAYSRAKLMHYVEGRFGRDIRVITSKGDEKKLPSFPFLELPIYTLLGACKDIGHTAITRDPEDGVVRKIPLVVKRGDKYFLQLAVLATFDYLGVRDKDLTLRPGKYLSMRMPSDNPGDEVRIPIDTTGQALVNFAGRPGPLGWRESFHVIPYLSVIDLWRGRRDSAALREALDGKYFGGAIGRLKDALSKSGSPTDKKELQNQIEKKTEELVDFIQLSTKRGEALIEKEADEERKRQLSLSLDQMGKELDLLEKLALLEENLSSQLREQVKGKICLVGAMFTGGTDFNATPYDPACPGIVTNGHVINMLLQKRFIRYDHQAYNITTLILLGLCISAVTMAVGTLAGGGILAGIIALYLSISYLLLSYSGVWIHVAGPLLAMVVSYTSVTVYRQLTEEKKRREIKHLFQHYLHPTVVEELARDPKKVKLGGQKKELTIHFSDIRRFTLLSEGLKPEELEQLLNMYLSAMTDVILKHGGTIDKYEGDAIMAFYGAPVDQPDHALRACKVTLESLEVLKDLNQTLKEKGWPSLKVGMGLNTGPVVVGNMGTKTRFDYTVIGDNVNLASRLESANKIFGTTILIGQNTYDLVKNDVFAIYLGNVRVMGKTHHIGVYNLVSLAENATPENQELDQLLSAGIRLCQERNFKEAQEYFAKVLSMRPGFIVAKRYLTECRTLMDNPPGPDWGGYLALEEK